MDGCVFCEIASGAIPAKILYRDAEVMAIAVLNPQAPTHLLVMPAAHYATLAEASQDRALLANLMSVASQLGKQHGGEGGFRLVVNTGPEGGQTVGHLHVHVLAGRRMTWPPG